MNLPARDSEDDDFEERLSSFQRAALPDWWRDEMVERAIPKTERRFPNPFLSFSRTERFAAGGMAAAWAAILILQTTHPAQPTAPPDHPVAAVAPETTPSLVNSPSFPMLAWRAHDVSQIEILLAP